MLLYADAKIVGQWIPIALIASINSIDPGQYYYKYIISGSGLRPNRQEGVALMPGHAVL
jgi:hypothetical protein